MSRFLQRSCFRKKSYGSAEAAHARWPKKRAYRCPMCSSYHVASKRSFRG